MEQMTIPKTKVGEFKVFMWRGERWVECMRVAADTAPAAWLAVHAKTPGSNFSSIRGTEATMYEYRENQKKYFRLKIVKQKNPQ